LKLHGYLKIHRFLTIICGASTTHLKGANILNRTNAVRYFFTLKKCIIVVHVRRRPPSAGHAL
jgi:hypothetical protein